MISQQPYTVEQVAALLDLHPKTVRGYVRDGRLKAVRVGKQYRITREDLDAFAGYPVAPPAAETVRRTRHTEVSTVVRIDAVSPETMSRISTLGLASVGGREGGQRLQVQTEYDEERAVMRIVMIGGLADTTELLRIIQVLIEEGQ
ncbi:MerR family transcriptional regulator [Sphaerisporangium melleum]|uniref:MerR family transcriptional regulator n=1 Tax=Sphaerisporangium melleum TaxID=321316 RepID=A0A917VQ25_9ACTN|nr:helix-turn-helix domain-containing protein [Sphaerisporangium melleum]GGL02809.1 MerR family transcriptional regulator [Sphaerisporangium melleum]GII69478.1 MerR family transcriptional regulator [Sphaerisporangium melleum]